MWSFSERLVFLGHACFAIYALMLVTMICAGTENYATQGHLLADAEIANRSASSN